MARDGGWLRGRVLVLDHSWIGGIRMKERRLIENVHSEPGDLCFRKMAGLGYDGWVEASGQHQKFSNGIRLGSSFTSLFRPFDEPSRGRSPSPNITKGIYGVNILGCRSGRPEEERWFMSGRRLSALGFVHCSYLLASPVGASCSRRKVHLAFEDEGSCSCLSWDDWRRRERDWIWRIGNVTPDDDCY
ncbi:hypothetical protein BJ508DRAFT_103136 [Ascobolus immersus RN42]|uniref:Uncharacterized protein n=1 Tax=Ascobolus immersus RN42 TaxID=1160509 RepID=A0A3N4I7C4_ASCIM|nr:hypothetical protein BJ508DRAFT_103136 [Ascobolus immersus RN42]